MIERCESCEREKFLWIAIEEFPFERIILFFFRNAYWFLYLTLCEAFSTPTDIQLRKVLVHKKKI